MIKESMVTLLLFGIKSNKRNKMKQKKKTYYGQSQTYYCSKCKRSHSMLSIIGREHIVYASKDMQKIAFKLYGLM